jgi:hypothetical protein
MADLTAQRTLVKSPPELWSELSEVESLARHLGELGEIKITKVEPETTVAWEGEQISGTVQLEQSGWGTKVTFHATVPEPDVAEPAPPELEPVPPEAEPVAEVEPVEVTVDPEPVTPPETVLGKPPPEPRKESRLRAWLFRRRTPAEAPAEPEPVAVEPERGAPEPEPVAIQPEPVAIRPEPVAIQPEPVAIQPEPVAIEPDPEPVLTVVDADRVQQVLDQTLDSLGQAHHRPFSRG